MKQPVLKKTLCAFVVAAAAFCAVGTSPLSIGQEAKDKKAKGRLPAYYSDIVTETQRVQIYSVQEKYAKQIDALNEQLNALEKQRDTEIEGMLTADQKEKLKKAREDAAAKKKKTAEDKKAAANKAK
jgi:hypothetical protein